MLGRRMGELVLNNLTVRTGLHSLTFSSCSANSKVLKDSSYKCRMMNEGDDCMNKGVLKIILTAVALGMGVGTFVLNILGEITMNNAINLLSIGIICLAVVKFQESK